MTEREHKQELLNKLYERFKATRPCTLCTPERTIVFGEGNPDAKLMFIGEAPGQEEDKQGKPFVGRSGQLLNKALSMVGIDRSNTYVTNVVKCRPPNNRTPTIEEMQNGKATALDEQIKIIKPKIICTLGATALNAFFGKQQKITQVHGKVLHKDGLDIIPIYHPAYILRNRKEATTWLKDLQTVKNMAEKYS